MIVPSEKIEAAAHDPERDGANDVKGVPVPEKLGVVYLRGEFLEATDSYIAARVPVERQTGDVDGPIPLLAFELARRLAVGGAVPQLALGEHVAGLKGKAGVNRPKIDREPPTYEKLGANWFDAVRPVRVAIDVRKLVQAAEAIGSNLVTLDVAQDSSVPLLVTPYDLGRPGPDYEGAQAFVMPLIPAAAPKSAEPAAGGD